MRKKYILIYIFIFNAINIYSQTFSFEEYGTLNNYIYQLTNYNIESNEDLVIVNARDSYPFSDSFQKIYSSDSGVAFFYAKDLFIYKDKLYFITFSINGRYKIVFIFNVIEKNKDEILEKFEKIEEDKYRKFYNLKKFGTETIEDYLKKLKE